MVSLSEKLRRERELRGISLEEISEHTRIGIRFLEALEQDKPGIINGEFYRRAYLRAYARYLGLDEERAINAYTFSQDKLLTEAVSVDDLKSKTIELSSWITEAVSVDDLKSKTIELSSWIIGIIVIAFLVILFFGFGSDPVRPQQPDLKNGDKLSNPIETPLSEKVHSSTDSRKTLFTQSPNLIASDEAIRIRIVVERLCWLDVRADGELAIRGLKRKGFEEELLVDREVRLWIGNAGGVSVWINEQPLQPLGISGQVRKDIVITKDNYMNFVVSKPESL